MPVKDYSFLQISASVQRSENLLNIFCFTFLFAHFCLLTKKVNYFIKTQIVCIFLHISVMEAQIYGQYFSTVLAIQVYQSIIIYCLLLIFID